MTRTWLESSYESVYGEIYSRLTKGNGQFNLQVRIPCNTFAVIEMPDGSKNEMGSGQYEFECLQK
jgi:alpha-L-rhamnosidase